jgi:hypothetical protein
MRAGRPRSQQITGPSVLICVAPSAIDYPKPLQTKSGALAIIISIEVHYPL